MIFTNDLLFYSRLPAKFYELVTGEPSKNNPGNSLRSYVIAKCIQEDNTSNLPESIVESYKECYEFSTDSFILDIIIEKLIDIGNKTLVESSSFNPSEPAAYKILRFETANLKSELDVLANSSLPSDMTMYSIEFEALVNLRQNMFEINRLISLVEHLLILPTPALA